MYTNLLSLTTSTKRIRFCENVSNNYIDSFRIQLYIPILIM